ncbi:MAG TPA: GNAT family N-acetyltransferase [Bradyrhizobium sp.]|uniref:GNAT family N-acetyltransferase n=1 Tax=Bradyrhizobium sp. TaxID=376 RepID=UPI002D80E894|nr:GNAT family N-acetyltransferase [Bradyrhizobium sp.]HET7886484.1 GNAT family N-acetyltransferase [Bradyrhizobium sp.]
MISVLEERAVDFESTARIATEAFGSKDVVFSASRMKWLYERGFGAGAAVLAAFDDDKKIGQIVLLHQKVHLDGNPVSATQLIDLFILQPYRSPALVRRLYQEVERLCEANHIRIILGLPNPISAPLNARFMKLRPFHLLPVRVGFSLRRPQSPRVRFSASIKSMTRDEAIERLSTFATPADENGPYWDAETLFERMNDPTYDYAVHATADLLLVSSSREKRGINLVLLCGFFARPGTAATSGEVNALIRAACRLWKHRVFAYAGINKSLPRLPGFAIPSRYRQPILLQLRDTASTAMPRFDHFQLIDSDFV